MELFKVDNVVIESTFEHQKILKQKVYIWTKDNQNTSNVSSKKIASTSKFPKDLFSNLQIMIFIERFFF